MSVKIMSGDSERVGCGICYRRVSVCWLKYIFQLKCPANPFSLEGSIFVFPFCKAVVNPIFQNGSCLFSSCAVCP